MSFFTCRAPYWGALKNVPQNVQDTHEHINQMLCFQFDMAAAVKDGVRRELVKKTEDDIWTLLHEFIVKMPGVKVQQNRPSNCDICGIISVVKNMARSQYAKECRNFMLSTLDELHERAGFDWIAAFDGYGKSAGLPTGYGIGKKVERAIELMAVLNKARDESAAELISHAPDPDDDNVPTIDQMLARTEQTLSRLRGSHLKVIR